MSDVDYKLVFTGTMGAGKTTAIAAISEIPPISTDVDNVDLEGYDKPSTTVALDYGEVTLEGGEKMRLFGTPGQARFDFMWHILAQGALGVIILVDNSRDDPVEDARVYLNAFSDAARASRVVIGLGRTDQHPTPGIDAYAAMLDEMQLSVPVLSVDVREREDVLFLVDVLFHQIEAAQVMVAE